jgi:hypothetical protein
MGEVSRPSEGDLGRRQFLLRAAVAGTVAAAVPTIVTMQPAGATGLTSPPPKPPIDIDPTSVDPPTNVGNEVVAEPPGPKTKVAGATSTLPMTGADVGDMVVAGLAATAGGSALLLWNAASGRSSASLIGPAPAHATPPTGGQATSTIPPAA